MYLRCFVKTFDDDEWLKYLYQLLEDGFNDKNNGLTHTMNFMNTAFLNNLLISSGANYINTKLSNFLNFHEVPNEYVIRAVYNSNFETKSSIGCLIRIQLIPLPFYRLQARKYGPFKVIGIDKSKLNYRLDISKSPFPNVYPVFYISELEPYHNKPRRTNTGTRRLPENYQ
ncbi:hypothetical protein BCR36DRAFT_441733, partial [Piromyces finnis]